MTPHADRKLFFSTKMLEELVVDSAAFIKCTRLDNLAKHICTIPEVLAEIRDKKSRVSLLTLPPHLEDLKIVNPSEEALKAGKCALWSLTMTYLSHFTVESYSVR